MCPSAVDEGTTVDPPTAKRGCGAAGSRRVAADPLRGQAPGRDFPDTHPEIDPESNAGCERSTG
jgi:hypothetical protein